MYNFTFLPIKNLSFLSQCIILITNNIKFDNNFVKAKLLQLANTVENDTTTLFNKYIIDDIAEKKGYSVL